MHLEDHLNDWQLWQTDHKTGALAFESSSPAPNCKTSTTVYHWRRHPVGVYLKKVNAYMLQSSDSEVDYTFESINGV